MFLIDKENENYLLKQLSKKGTENISSGSLQILDLMLDNSYEFLLPPLHDEVL